MAVVWSVNAGNVSVGANWNTGVVPGINDDVYADGKAMVIDQNWTVLSIRTTQRPGGTLGGSWTISGGYTVNATGAGIISGASASSNFYVTTASPTTTIINAIVTSNAYYAIDFSGTGTFILTGNSFGGNTSTGHAVRVTGNGTYIYTGTATAGSGGAAHCMINTGLATISLTGIFISTNYYAFYSQTACSVNINGICQIAAGGTVPSIYMTSTTSLLTFAGSIINYNNIVAVQVPRMRLLSASSVIWSFSDDLGNTVNLTNVVPNAGDLRNGTVVGAVTGTLKVPPPASVALNVPTDNTVGTLEMTPSDFWTYATRTLTSGGGGITAADVWGYLTTGTVMPDSILELILSNLDAKVSSITGTTPAQIWGYLLANMTVNDSIGKLIADYLNGKITDIPKEVINELETSINDVAVRIRNLATVEAVGDIHAT